MEGMGRIVFRGHREEIVIECCVLFYAAGLDETTKLVQSIGGYCKSYVVDISKREEVYKAADQMRNEIGDVSFSNSTIICLC